ncbi:REP-associated tyrosine transposase [Haloferula sp. A504]|uniref:REP-associated tyrosine transposase n=1 Tax=Haloferula sp. A504 TaxID=3373601 RepID=UPI0031BBD425|nr:transposase [Verrucomicrobiaceae bacterium E54]
MPEAKQRGWYSRGYLPHLDFREAIQAVTFRLADAVPRHLIERWRSALRYESEEERTQLLRKIARYEDVGAGACLLRNPDHARIVAETLQHFDGDRYRLLEWVVMPNHVHVLFRPDAATLDRIVQSWKRFSARQINRRLERSGIVWARDYFDRYIRDESHFNRTRAYIRNNPVKAGLCSEPEEWPFGSAFRE